MKSTDHSLTYPPVCTQMEHDQPLQLPLAVHMDLFEAQATMALLSSQVSKP